MIDWFQLFKACSVFCAHIKKYDDDALEFYKQILLHEAYIWVAK